MKFTIQTTVILEGLKSVHQRARSSSIELLKHIRFSLKGSRLTLLGHDLNSSSEAYLMAEGSRDGSCAIPSDSVVKLVGSLPKEAHVEFELKDFGITIKAGRSKYKLPVLVVDSYPEPLLCEDAKSVTLDASDVAQLFGRPSAIIDADDQRLQWQGCYLHTADGKVASAAIGRYHFVRLLSKATLPELIGVIVPFSAMTEIVRLGAGRLSISERTVAYEVEGRRFCSKLIDAKYLDYMRSIPALGGGVEVDRQDMLDAARRLSILTAKESDVLIDFMDSELHLAISGAGDGSETVRSTGSVSGAQIAISPSQFVDALSLPNGAAVRLHVEKGKQYLRIVDPDEPSALFLESTRIPKHQRVAA